MAGQNVKCVNCDQSDQRPAKKYRPAVPEGMILVDAKLIHEIIDLPEIPANIKQSLQGWIKDI